LARRVFFVVVPDLFLRVAPALIGPDRCHGTGRVRWKSWLLHSHTALCCLQVVHHSVGLHHSMVALGSVRYCLGGRLAFSLASRGSSRCGCVLLPGRRITGAHIRLFLRSPCWCTGSDDVLGKSEGQLRSKASLKRKSSNLVIVYNVFDTDSHAWALRRGGKLRPKRLRVQKGNF